MTLLNMSRYFFLDMIFLPINYHLVMKDQYILKFDYFAIELS